MRQLDVSTGKEPVPAYYDLKQRIYTFFVDGEKYVFACDALPFTLDANWCADSALVLKHGKPQ